MAAKFKALIKAVKDNSLASVKQLLSDKSFEFDINEVIDRKPGRTILHVAVANKTVNIELVKLLLHNNARVNEYDRRQKSPLHTAVVKDRIEVVELLLEHGADPNCQDCDGETPFHHCFGTGNILLMNLMLKYQGDISVKDSDGRNALHHAAEYGTCEMVKHLVQMGMDVNAHDIINSTPLHSAMKNNCIEVVELLLKCGADPNWGDTGGVTSFHFCFGKGINILLMNVMLQYRADINVKDDDGRNALHYAAMEGTCAMVERLIQMDMNVNDRDYDDWTPLHSVVLDGNTEDTLSKIRLLVNNGADINALNDENFTPLCCAVYYDSDWTRKSSVLETITCFLELGANPNVHGDKSPLFLAASNHQIKCIELLLKYGANKHFKDANGCSVLRHAIYTGPDVEVDHIVKRALDIVKVLLIQGVTSTQNDHLDVEPSMFQKLKECESEYNNLKVTRICECFPLTYGDLLIISNDMLARHLRRKDVCAGIEYDQKKGFFNYFSDNIEKKYLSGLELNDFIDLLDEVFEKVLPHDVVVMISQYFNEEDLNTCFSKNQKLC